MMTHPPLLGQWCVCGQCVCVGWWGHTAAHCGHRPHTADILLPVPRQHQAAHTSQAGHGGRHTQPPPNTPHTSQLGSPGHRRWNIPPCHGWKRTLTTLRHWQWSFNLQLIIFPERHSLGTRGSHKYYLTIILWYDMDCERERSFYVRFIK